MATIQMLSYIQQDGNSSTRSIVGMLFPNGLPPTRGGLAGGFGHTRVSPPNAGSIIADSFGRFKDFSLEGMRHIIAAKGKEK